jgi:cytochrome P450
MFLLLSFIFVAGLVTLFILKKYLILQSFRKQIQGKNLKFIKTKDLNFGFGQSSEIFNFDKLFNYLLKSREFGEPIFIHTTIIGAGKLFHFQYFSAIEVLDPEIVKEICLSKKYGKPNVTNQIFQSLVGQGLVASEGDIWRRHRNLIMPSFSPKNVHRMIYSMSDVINQKLDSFATGNESLVFTDFNEQISQITLYVILAVAFGVDIENKDKLAHLFEELTVTFANTLLGIIMVGKWFTELPLPFFWKYQSVRKEIHHIVDDIINKKRKQEQPKEYNELMSTLIYSTDENGENFTDQEIFDESMV